MKSEALLSPSPSPAAARARLGPAMALLAALAVAAIAAALGYRHQLAGDAPADATAAAPAAVAASAPVASAPSPAAAAVATRPRQEARADGDAAPAWPLWEFRLRQPVPPRDPPLTPPGWQLMGASRSDGVWQLIVLKQGQPAPQFLKVGDTLPGGLRIVEITETDVTLARGRRRIVLSYIGYR